jgi:hypothetical protein
MILSTSNFLCTPSWILRGSALRGSSPAVGATSFSRMVRQLHREWRHRLCRSCTGPDPHVLIGLLLRGGSPQAMRAGAKTGGHP